MDSQENIAWLIPIVTMGMNSSISIFLTYPINSVIKSINVCPLESKIDYDWIKKNILTLLELWRAFSRPIAFAMLDKGPLVSESPAVSTILRFGDIYETLMTLVTAYFLSLT